MTRGIVASRAARLGSVSSNTSVVRACHIREQTLGHVHPSPLLNGKAFLQIRHSLAGLPEL
jgi:hypothetical protein